MKRATAKRAAEATFPLSASIGAAIRFTHLAFAEDLQARLALHSVSVGMWYFLRALWEEDGLTQRQLSRRIGLSEPTAAQQLHKMVRNGLIARRPSQADRRKLHIHLTPSGRALEREMLPYAVEVNAAALAGLSRGEIETLANTLARIRENLEHRRALGEVATLNSADNGARRKRSSRLTQGVSNASAKD